MNEYAVARPTVVAAWVYVWIAYIYAGVAGMNPWLGLKGGLFSLTDDTNDQTR